MSSREYLGMQAGYWLAFLVTAVLFAVLISSAAFPPITDLPQHLAQIRLLEELLGIRETVFDRSNYRINWFAPNTLVYLPLWGLESAFDSFTAGRLTMYLLAIGWSFSIIYLAGRRNLAPVQAVLACVFILNLAFYWGFINFLFAFPLFVCWLIYATPERIANFGPREFLVSLLLLVLLLGAHSLWFLLAVAWYGLLIAYGWKQKTLPLARGALAFTPVILPLAYSAFWFPALSESLATAGFRVQPVWNTFPWDRLSINSFPDYLLGGLTGPMENALVLLTFVWIGLCIYSNWDHIYEKLDKALAGCALILWAVFLLAPDFYTNTMLFNQRWAAPAMIFTLLALPVPRFSRLIGAIPVVLFSAFVAASSLVWKAYDDTELTGLRESLDKIPPDSRVMWLSFEQSPRFKNPPFLQIGALSQAMAGSEVNFSFAELGTGLIVLEAPRKVAWTRNLEWYPGNVKPEDFRVFDYIIANGSDAVHENLMENSLKTTVYSERRFKLYIP